MFKKKTIERIRRILLMIALFIAVVYGVNRILLFRSFDTKGPEITFDKELIKVSVEASEKKLLKGVKAQDEKDGDVTDSIIIESISKMQDNNERIVTYVAFDSDNNVTKAERRIRYKGYKGPRFYMTGPLGTSLLTAGTAEMLDPLKAEDAIDGDISNQIVVVGTDIGGLSSEDASFVFEVQVTNSSGDIASLKLPVKVSTDGSTATGVELKEYLIYTKVNKKVDLADNIKGGDEGVEIVSNIKYSEPGVYVVNYESYMGGSKLSTPLYVVVEE